MEAFFRNEKNELKLIVAFYLTIRFFGTMEQNN